MNRLFYVIILFCWSVLIAKPSDTSSTNILVLHSYHPTFKWNLDINEGIVKRLSSQPIPYQLVMEYMDTKRTTDSIAWETLFNLYKLKYSKITFDLIIISDDDALIFLQRYGQELFPEVPVVFCGINNYSHEIKQTTPHYTGVIEKLDLSGTVEEALSLFPLTNHIFFVGDHSTTAHDLSNIFRENHQPLFPDVNFHYLHEKNLYSLAEKLSVLPTNSLVMLWPFLREEENQIVLVEYATQTITKASNAPVFGFWHFMLGYGIVGGKLVSGIVQGEKAAELAIRILNGESAENIPVVESMPNDFYFDYNTLKNFEIPLKNLPRNSSIINSPVSFLTKNKNALKGGLLAMAFFSIIFLINYLSNRKIKKILRRELDFQHELINALPNPVFYTLDNHLVEDCNKAFEKLIGFTKNQIIGKEIPAFYVPRQKDYHKSINEEILLTHKPITYEGQIIVQENIIRDVIFYKTVIFNKRTKKYGIIETIVDITDKKIAVEKIRASEERYALVTKATKDGIWDWNLNNKELFTSTRFKEILGYDENDAFINHENLHQQVHPSDISVFEYQINLLKENTKDSIALELKMRRKNGSYVWVEIKVFAITDKKGNINRLVGSIGDIQSRKDSELSLKKWEEIFNSTLMGIATTLPPALKPDLMNPVFAHIHGYTKEEITTKLFSDLIATEFLSDFSEICDKANNLGHHVTESIHVRKDGSRFPVMIDITAVKTNRNELLYFIINLQDISQRKMQENRIAQMLQNEQTMNEELRSSEEEVRQTLQQTVHLKEKLEENQKQFLSFINGTSDFAILKDKKLRYVIVNESFAKFYNQKPEQLVGKSDDEITPSWLAMYEQENDLKVLNENKPIIYERELDGQFFEIRKFPVYFENNNIGVGAFIRDITRQRVIEQQVQENEQRFKTLLENSYDLITLTDSNGVILYCTDAIHKIIGYTNQEVVGKHLSQFFHPEDRAEFVRKLEKVLSTENEPAYIQHRVKHTALGYRNIETIATNHMHNSLINAIVFTSRDVSLELQSRELKKNIALAQKSSEIKQQFLANMSHEIRTPMNGIVGMIEFLLKTPLNAIQDDYVKTIKYSADSLLNIINDILDFSKIEAGKLSINPTPVHIKKFITDAPKIFAALVKQKNIDFNVFIDESLPEYLNTDPMRLNQVISNLLSNAIKFTPTGSISMRVFPDQIKNDIISLKIEVQDTGIGISEEEQKKLFRPFFQIDSSLTRSIEGTGLGLTICHRIVELMGGEIGVISAPGKGSMFWFTITSSIPELEKVKKFVGESENIKVKNLDINVLLVEDKVVNQKVIKLMLESMGCGITIASNGKVAIDILTKHQKENEGKPAFDIILMDIQMPVMDGITATKIIRKQFREYPVIIGLSANVFSSDVEGFLKSGLDDYIIKPAKSEDLYKKLLYWYEKRKTIEANDNEESRQIISNLEKEIIIENQSFDVILTQSENNPMVLNELFAAFYNDAADLAKNIRNDIKKGDSILSEHIQTLFHLALSMGARQIAKTCEILSENSNNQNLNIESILNFLEQSIKNYASEVIENYDPGHRK
jgi:PAS domain S-box-containing protein